MIKIPLSIEKEILSAFNGGLVPSRGTGFVQMGRDSELSSVMANLDSTGEKDGLGVFRFVVGQYGSGKSFMLQFIREVAIHKGFVVMSTDITRECRFTGSSKEGLKLYRELIKNMTVKTQPKGGALEIVLKKWISTLRSDLAKGNGIDESNEHDSHRDQKNHIRHVVSANVQRFHPHGFQILARIKQPVLGE